MYPNNSELSYNSLFETPEFSALNGIVWKFCMSLGFCILYTIHKTKTAILNYLNIVNCANSLKIQTKGVQGFRISPNIQIIRLMVLGLCILYFVYKRKRLKRLNNRNCLTIQTTPHYAEIVDKALNILTMHAHENSYGLYIVHCIQRRKKKKSLSTL